VLKRVRAGKKREGASVTAAEGEEPEPVAEGV